MYTENHQSNAGRMPISTRHHHSGRHWYVIRTTGRKECKVKEYIDKAIRTNAKFAGSVSRVLVPMEEVKVIRNGKAAVMRKPRISGYVYVEADLTDRIQSLLCSVPNVLGFLNYSRSDSKPMPLSHREAEALLASMGDVTGGSRDAAALFCKGDRVMITDGPFCGFNASVEEVDSGRGRLKVSVRVFGRETPMELEFGQVKGM